MYGSNNITALKIKQRIKYDDFKILKQVRNYTFYFTDDSVYSFA